MKAFNIWVTRRCNLNCKYCYEGTTKSNIDFNNDNINDLIEFIKYNSEHEEYLYINFHGGEPLLKFELIKIICNKLKELDVPTYYSLTTNGTLFNEEILKFILNYKIYISISIDGNRVNHDCNRIDCLGKGSYGKVTKNLKKILNGGILPRIRMTVTPDTVPYLYENIEHLVFLGCKNIVAIPNLYDKGWSDNDLIILKNQLYGIKNKIIEEDISFSFFEGDSIVNKGKCMGGIRECSIDVDTLIYPCSLLVDNKEFNIGSLSNGIDNIKVNELKEIYNASNIDCEGCTYEKYCVSTRCKFLNKIITNDYLKSIPLVCELERIIYEIVLE